MISSNLILSKLSQLSNNTLAEAFKILYGDNWKNNFTINDKAREMHSIFEGGTQPCVHFKNWLKCIEFLSNEIENFDNDLSNIWVRKMGIANHDRLTEFTFKYKGDTYISVWEKNKWSNPRKITEIE